MAIQAHLVELERKHKVLENELHEALVHLSTDDLQIVELKRRKLMVKDADRAVEAYHRRNAALAFATQASQIPAIIRGMLSGAIAPPGLFAPLDRVTSATKAHTPASSPT